MNDYVTPRAVPLTTEKFPYVGQFPVVFSNDRSFGEDGKIRVEHFFRPRLNTSIVLYE